MLPFQVSFRVQAGAPIGGKRVELDPGRLSFFAMSTPSPFILSLYRLSNVARKLFSSEKSKPTNMQIRSTITLLTLRAPGERMEYDGS